MSDDKFKDGETIYKGGANDPIPEDAQKLVDEGKAIILHRVQNVWLGYPRTIGYAMIVGAALLYAVGAGPLAQHIAFGLLLALSVVGMAQFTALTKAYTRVRNVMEEHRAFNSMMLNSIKSAVKGGEGTFEDEFGLSKDEDSSDTVH